MVDRPLDFDEAYPDETPAEAAAPSPRSPKAPMAGSWPTLDLAAHYGLAGDVVELIDAHTEADPVAVLLDFLASFGNGLNAGPHVLADGALHPARLFVCIVGSTSRGRKRTAHARVRQVNEVADPVWSGTRVMGGLASGEGLIAAVADAEGDEPNDRRLMAYEPEFARVLAVANREGSTLSAILREAWDTGNLRVMTRKEPLAATGAHISAITHVTVDELRRRLSESEIANGLANRFLFAVAKRSKLLPSGGNLDDSDVHRLGAKVREALETSRRFGRLHRTPAADELWTRRYHELADTEPGGMVGAVTARAEAQLLRLSLVYALLDGSNRIDVPHLEAAWAVWRYCEAGSAYIFGDAIGDEVADRLLAAVREAGEDGLDGTAQRDLFLRHVSGARLHQARRLLAGLGKVRNVTEQTGGRPRTITYALALKAS